MATATCHWLTPTRILPHPFSSEAASKPWTCLRDGAPHALCDGDVERCVVCSRWQARTFEDVRRDIAYETFGVGIDLPNPTFDDVRRAAAWETFGVIV